MGRDGEAVVAVDLPLLVRMTVGVGCVSASLDLSVDGVCVCVRVAHCRFGFPRRGDPLLESPPFSGDAPWEHTVRGHRRRMPSRTAAGGARDTRRGFLPQAIRTLATQVPINEKSIVVTLQAHSNWGGWTESFHPDSVGQILLYKPELPANP